jgi:sulfite oxidase
MVPLPKTNPVLTGERWKQYHSSCGLDYIVNDSWDFVLKEKAADMTHVLQFPYNGEAPGVRALFPCCIWGSAGGH